MNMRTFVRTAAAVFGLTMIVGNAHGQAEGYQPPQCDLDLGHFLVKNTVVYITSASQEADPAKRANLLRNAQQNLDSALAGDQTENPAVWYFLGRYYVLKDDVVGVDSAFAHTMRLAPECQDDVKYYRMVMWAPKMNEAIDSLNAGNMEATKRLLRTANTIFDEDNVGYYYLGVIYGQDNELDSALHYFRKVAEVGAIDSTRERNVEVSTYNVGLLYAAQEQWDSAVVWYQKYRGIVPDDPQGLVGLATAYTQLGNTDQAAVMYDSVFNKADSLSMGELFQAGQNLFAARRLNLAAKAFELGLEKNRLHRDGLYNLVNSYLAMAQDTSATPDERREAARGMERAARRLVSVEPRGQEAMRLLAASFQIRRMDDSTLAVLQRVEAMAFGIEVYQAEIGDSSITVRGTISNQRNATTKLPPITFEFLDRQGNVLTTAKVDLAQLGAHASEDFEVTGSAADISAWRYAVGS